MFVCVPLADDGKYRIPSHEMDVTHMIRENEGWWHDMFESAGWSVYLFSFRVEGIKESYYKKYPRGHGFFVLERKKQ